MGRRRCNPIDCPIWSSAIVCSFYLEDNMNSARITTDNGKSWTFKVSSDVKKAFNAFQKENETNIVPNYGLAIVDVKNKNLHDAIVKDFLPFNDPTELDKPNGFSTYLNQRLSHQKALDLYNKWFEEAIMRPEALSCE